MKCSHCGAEVKNEKLFCPVCGKTMEIATPKNVLEDDVLAAMLDEHAAEIRKDAEELFTPEMLLDAKECKKREKEAERIQREMKEAERAQRMEAERKKFRRRILVVVIVLAAIVAAFIVAGSLYLQHYNQTHSVSYYQEQAEKCFNQKDYNNALTNVEEALALEPDNAECLLLKGEIYASDGNTEEAKNLLLQAAKADGSCVEAYAYLLDIYDKEGNLEAIQELMGMSDDEEVQALFSDFNVETPKAWAIADTDNETLTLYVSVEDDSLKCYYTLDESYPTEQDNLYVSPVTIGKDEADTVTVISMNSHGSTSDVTTVDLKQTYEDAEEEE